MLFQWRQTNQNHIHNANAVFCIITVTIQNSSFAVTQRKHNKKLFIAKAKFDIIADGYIQSYLKYKENWTCESLTDFQEYLSTNIKFYI